MARIELAPEVLDDFDRILDHLRSFDSPDAPGHVTAIVQAVDILADNPLIGRPVRYGKRELIIGRGGHGYVALYRFVPAIDTVFVLALRSQREAGYGRMR